MNVGASNITDYGNYYQYGKGSSTIQETYKDYDYDGGEDPVNSSVDTAYQAWGSAWHVPTKDQWEELVEYTDAEQVTISGVTGFQYTSKSNNNSIFLPNAGYKQTSQINTDIITDSGTRGKYLTSTPDEYDCWGYSQKLEFDENSLEVVSDYRDTGFSVRPVQGAVLPQHEYIEIGGVKWATMNIGAENITDPGLYFQWGDTQGYTAEQVGSGEGKKYFGWEDYKYGNGTTFPGTTGITKYNVTDGKTILEVSDDAVTGNWGGQWRMPTVSEIKSLIDNTTTTWVTDYQGSGVAGKVFTDKTDSSKVLFFPAAGGCNEGNIEYVGSYGFYWSSSIKDDDKQSAYMLGINVGSVVWEYGNPRYNGYPVRAILDE